MTNDEMKAKWAKITDPLEALQAVVENSQFLGGDPYYNDIVDALLTMASRCVEAPQPEKPALSAALVARAFSVMLPASEDETIIEHNPHKGWCDPDGDADHQGIASYLAKHGRSRNLDFTGPAEQQKIEATGELWVLQYTPAEQADAVCLAAASLDAIAQWLEDNGMAFGS